MKSSRLVALSADRKPPSELLLIPFGRISTRKGEFLLTPESANSVIMKYREHGVDLMLDYEHLALEPNGPSPAAGWAQVNLKSDGIWLTHIKWTPRMTEFLKNGEYRYLSPAFEADAETKEIVELINVAVTNLPATDHIEALVAASRVALKIVHRGNKWILYDSSGKKVLGTHATKEQAEAQESAINIAKARKAGHKIPKAASRTGQPAKNFAKAAAPVTHSRGIQAAGGVLQGARGGLNNVSRAEVASAKRHSAKHYHQLGAKAPWETKEKKTMTFQERLQKFVLSRKDLTVGELCVGLGIDKATLTKLAGGAVPSQEEMAQMKKGPMSMDIFQGEGEKAQIDTSMDGMDVNAMIGHKDEDAASAIFDTARSEGKDKDTDTSTESSESSDDEESMHLAMGDESHVSVSGDEAGEDQGDKDIAGAIGMRMRQDRLKEIVRLTGRSNVEEALGVVMGWKSAAESYKADHEEVVKLRREADARERRELVTLGKTEGKLTPSLIKFYEKRPNTELRAFLSVAPVVVEQAGHKEPAPGGFDSSLGLTAEEALIESLLPTSDPKEYVALKRQLLPTISKDSSESKTSDSLEYQRAITLSLIQPTVEPVGFMPRKRVQ